MTFIEAVESRTLFAANVPEALVRLAEASSNPAVQETFNLVKADLTAINNARGGNTRAELQQIIDTGLVQLPTARDALRGFRDADPAVRDAAIAAFKASRANLADSLAAARANLKASAVENRAALRESASSLRVHLKQLRKDLRNAANAPTAPLTPTPTPTTPTPTTSTPVSHPPITSSTVATDISNGVPTTLGILFNNDTGGNALFYGNGDLP